MTDRIPSASPGASAALHALARARTSTEGMAQELLTHLPELGDTDTQRSWTAGSSRPRTPCWAVSTALEHRLLELGRGEGGGRGGALEPDAAPASPSAERGVATVTRSDTGSVSALGGALRTQALRLADHEERLETAARRAVRSGAADPTHAERALLRETAVELDRVGAALQAWTADTTEDRARLRGLADEAGRSELRGGGGTTSSRPRPRAGSTR